MTPQDWTRLIGMIQDIGLEVVSIDKRKGLIVCRLPGWARQQAPSTKKH